MCSAINAWKRKGQLARSGLRIGQNHEREMKEAGRNATGSNGIKINSICLTVICGLLGHPLYLVPRRASETMYQL